MNAAAGVGRGLGACVRVSLEEHHPAWEYDWASHRWRRASPTMSEEGVVIELVLAGRLPQTPRIVTPHAYSAARLTRYVVQTWHQRVLRPASELIVMAP